MQHAPEVLAAPRRGPPGRHSPCARAHKSCTDARHPLMTDGGGVRLGQFTPTTTAVHISPGLRSRANSAACSSGQQGHSPTPHLLLARQHARARCGAQNMCMCGSAAAPQRALQRTAPGACGEPIRCVPRCPGSIAHTGAIAECAPRAWRDQGHANHRHTKPSPAPKQATCTINWSKRCTAERGHQQQAVCALREVWR
jgi:hypothetical protein